MGERVGSGSSVKVRFWIWFEGMADRFAVGVKDREEERICLLYTSDAADECVNV